MVILCHLVSDVELSHLQPYRLILWYLFIPSIVAPPNANNHRYLLTTSNMLSATILTGSVYHYRVHMITSCFFGGACMRVVFRRTFFVLLSLIDMLQQYRVNMLANKLKISR